MRARDIPNMITVMRFLLVPPVVWLLLEGRFAAALLLFLVAGVSDGVDGFLAKHYGWTSRIGGLLDPLADKFLLVSCFVTLGWLGVIPLWLVIVVVLRDLIILAGALAYHFRVERLIAEPSIISKLNTLSQILLVLAVLYDRGIAALPESWLAVLVYSVLATTLLSGIDYVWTWGWRAWNKRHGTGGAQ
ncbi:CDP-alcohol phosphatidyltransferase family protein [Thiohalobacter sp. IOR34]|uniref:CDP-alcohol phosphatidyltransferase family protein n=1 Tax=Thiohalobacter sp. IOR34 TaxID=3057176 RepID=UPI0025B0B071|nr:CDP-alcohol phosphatidyltransferase family protein [Thiohalobacter sp. IOR34]WJW76064.1 CDP-alcohol phosphatidyltransferase family protein [Thiohalobacter sp. IOR34]